jgi:hypothetical protein
MCAGRQTIRVTAEDAAGSFQLHGPEWHARSGLFSGVRCCAAKCPGERTPKHALRTVVVSGEPNMAPPTLFMYDTAGLNAHYARSLICPRPPKAMNAPARRPRDLEVGASEERWEEEGGNSAG